MFNIVLALLLGLGVGIIASLIGVGGGFLLVPLLHILMGMNIHKAIGTSLFVIVFIALTATISYYRKNLILFKIGLFFEIGSIPGSVLGSLVSKYLPSNILRLIFSCLLFYVAYKMWKGKVVKSETNKKKESYREVNLKKIFMLIGSGSIAGFLSGLLGIGGGVVKVPMMVSLFYIPIHYAVATSEFMITITASTGLLVHTFLQNVDFTAGIILVPSTIIGSYTGSRIAVRVKRRVLRRIFSIAVTLISIRLIVETLLSI